jgi:hypothetical protein
MRRVTVFIAETRALLALHRAGGQPVKSIASHGLRVGDAGGARGRKTRAGGKSRYNVRSAAE